MNILQGLLGAALLFLGRKLYWFFVGAVGFVTGLSLAAQWLRGSPELVILLIGIALGVVGAVLALLLQRVVVAIAGFLAGGYIAGGLLGLLTSQSGRAPILVFVFGGVVGALLMIFLFDGALIVLSSLTGASMIVQSLNVGQGVAVVVFLVLLAVGIGAQSSMMRRSREAAPPSPPAPA